MNEQFLKAIKQPLGGFYRPSVIEPGTAKKPRSVLLCIVACLLLFEALLMSPLFAADEEEARLAAISADVAAGTDIVNIIKNAMTAGLPLDRIVQEIIMAGVDPCRVVYLAITANYAPADVVRGAAAAIKKMSLSDAVLQTNIATIISCARQAGASATAVNAGLTDAGISADVIANATAQAEASPAPVYGYTPGTPAAPATTVVGGAVGQGGTGSLIGGSGIGAPPTTASGNKPASPTKP